jgi:flagellar biosynthesis component FlhA
LQWPHPANKKKKKSRKKIDCKTSAPICFLDSNELSVPLFLFFFSFFLAALCSAFALPRHRKKKKKEETQKKKKNPDQPKTNHSLSQSNMKTAYSACIHRSKNSVGRQALTKQKRKKEEKRKKEKKSVLRCPVIETGISQPSNFFFLLFLVTLTVSKQA